MDAGSIPEHATKRRKIGLFEVTQLVVTQFIIHRYQLDIVQADFPPSQQ